MNYGVRLRRCGVVWCDALQSLFCSAIGEGKEKEVAESAQRKLSQKALASAYHQYIQPTIFCIQSAQDNVCVVCESLERSHTIGRACVGGVASRLRLRMFDGCGSEGLPRADANARDA